MLIIGHRGAAGLAKENTISSFKRAHEHGAQWIECDLRKTKDGKIVIAHDASLHRTHGAPVKISQVTLAEIKQLTGQHDEAIAELAELISVSKLPISIDIKVVGLESELLQTLKPFAHNVLVTCWNPLVLNKIKALGGKIEIGFTLNHVPKSIVPIVMKIVRLMCPELTAISLHKSLATDSNIKALQKMGLKVNIYTVNDEDHAQELKNFGADAIFTDYPNKMSKLA